MLYVLNDTDHGVYVPSASFYFEALTDRGAIAKIVARGGLIDHDAALTRLMILCSEDAASGEANAECREEMWADTEESDLLVRARS